MTQEKKIDRVILGGSATQAKLLSIAAENFFRQRKLEEAKAVADEAIKTEDATGARELKGYILTTEGKLDEAEAEFGAIDSKAGMAKVALERGDYEKAASLADEDTTGYGATIKGQAQMRSGKLEEAAATLASAFSKEIPDWQRSEALNAHGRVQQELGQTDAAIGQYERAIALDPYNVVALSNEGAAKRASGDLEGAQAALERAQNIRQDELATMMLQQIQREMRRANDLERAKLIDKQIQDLSARIKEMKDSGEQQQSDSWSTRPLILAFLPSDYTPVFFERAGTDVVLQRELEAALQAGGEVGVVEREMLDKLLQELNLGSSELASPDTQRNLGRVLSAGVLGFIEFAQLGADKMMYLRLVDSETSAIAGIIRHKVDENNPAEVVRAVAEELIATMANGGELKGKIADASADDAIYINLGSRHGAVAGQEFIVLEDADPIKIGDRVIAHRTKPVGKIVVTNLETDYAICKVTQRQDGVKFAPEMKIQAAK
jgi:tetratricopeptide (TPR) repeat protein